MNNQNLTEIVIELTYENGRQDERIKQLEKLVEVIRNELLNFYRNDPVSSKQDG